MVPHRLPLPPPRQGRWEPEDPHAEIIRMLEEIMDRLARMEDALARLVKQ